MNALAPSFIAGASSALIYYFVIRFGLGFLFLFLPTLPVFWLSLRGRSIEALQSALIAATLLVILAGLTSAIAIYLLMLGLPAWYIGHESLKKGSLRQATIWFPLTVVFARLMTACSFALLAVTLYFSGEPGGLPGMIAPQVSEAISALSSELDSHTSETLNTVAPNIAFLIFSISAWMWALCLYVHAWITSRELKRQEIAIRPDMSVAGFPPPNWMITLLLIAATASLIGGVSLAFWGKASIIILLFPYFLLGAALVHQRTRRYEFRNLLLFAMYFLMGALLWPVFIVAGYGVVYHVRLLNKYLSGGRNSSRS